MENNLNASDELIGSSIHVIRGFKVILDENLAKLYGVSVKRLNEQVKRNIKRFPSDFRFQLTDDEITLRLHFATSNKSENLGSQILTSSKNQNLRSQVVTLREGNMIRSQNATLRGKHGKHRKYLPYAFTEQGVAMLSGLLRSPTAIAVNIEIMRTFVKMRHFLENQNKLNKELSELKSFLLKKSQNNTAEFKRVWKAINSNSEDSNEDQKIGFKLNHHESD